MVTGRKSNAPMHYRPRWTVRWIKSPAAAKPCSTSSAGRGIYLIHHGRPPSRPPSAPASAGATDGEMQLLPHVDEDAFDVRQMVTAQQTFLEQLQPRLAFRAIA